ncbi:uncharacterized protein PAN0_019d5848 [Moesziomyces antarcticus]|uniref:Uncharacterized protein n=1 Tax=Pseudozyma antarctica TaxID=84753 RepID=A0A081CLS4_PSEA2|nr:uncharacterized protein PAN0_019d5848 [Moesziomyces antarcticus]GAK67620.1 hypothetical protein PAN0_019d5848 [Moesziomyces antarcticus]
MSIGRAGHDATSRRHVSDGRSVDALRSNSTSAPGLGKLNHRRWDTSGGIAMMLSTPIATLHHHQPDLAPAAAGFFERQGDTAAQARDEAALRSSSSSRVHSPLANPR